MNITIPVVTGGSAKVEVSFVDENGAFRMFLDIIIIRQILLLLLAMIFGNEEICDFPNAVIELMA